VAYDQRSNDVQGFLSHGLVCWEILASYCCASVENAAPLPPRKRRLRLRVLACIYARQIQEL
jgi:hypothetical protein